MKKPLIFALIAAVMAFPVCWSGAAQVSTVTGLMIEKGFTPVAMKRAHNDVYAPCKLNGRNLDLKVDTGAGGTLVTSMKLTTLGVALNKVEGNFRGAIGPMSKSMKVGDIKDFQVGSYQAGSHPVGSWDFSYRPRPGKGMSMDGLLGIDFLYRHQAVIDCFQMNLFLKAPSAPSSSATLGAGLRAGGCTEIPIHVTHDGLAVATRINGRSGYLILDTGAPNTLLRGHAIADLNMRRASAGIGLRMIDVGKNVTGLGMVYFSTMEIGGFSVPAQGVGVAELPGGKGGPGDVFFGYLGQDLLAYYCGVIDCRALKLFLRLDPVVEAARKSRS